MYMDTTLSLHFTLLYGGLKSETTTLQSREWDPCIFQSFERCFRAFLKLKEKMLWKTKDQWRIQQCVWMSVWMCVGGNAELSDQEAKNVTYYSPESFVHTAPTLFRIYGLKIVGQFLEGHRSFKIACILDVQWCQSSFIVW